MITAWHCPACGHDLVTHGAIQAVIEPGQTEILICVECPFHVCEPEPEQVSAVLVIMFSFHLHHFHEHSGV